jgi:hypothetical protein
LPVCSIKAFLFIQERRELSASKVNTELRMQQLRAGKRVNSRVPVGVEWSEKGQTYSAQGWTIDVGPTGCLAVVPQGFAVGQRLKLVNLVNKKSSEATLIWRGHEGRAGWELGLELQDPPEEFWAIEF